MGEANRCGDEKMINKWARDKLVDRLRIDARKKTEEEKQVSIAKLKWHLLMQ